MNITDPLGKLAAEKAEETAKKAIEEAPEEADADSDMRWPRVEKAYISYAFSFTPDSDFGVRALTGSDCAIGSNLLLAFDQNERDGLDRGKVAEDSDAPDTVVIASRSSRRLGTLAKKDASLLRNLHDDGWEINVFTMLISYAHKDNKYSCEAVAMCAAPDVLGADISSIHEFEHQSRKRIRGGDHPQTALTQEQFEKVLESSGQWFMTKSAPLPQLGEGEKFLKRRRSWTDALIDASLEHRIGCGIFSVAFWVALVGFLVWFFFFR